MFDQELKLWIHHVSIKIQFFQNVLNNISTTKVEVKISARSDVFYWSYCPQTPKNGFNSVLNQKISCFFYVKLESIDGCIQKVYMNGPIIDQVKIWHGPQSKFQQDQSLFGGVRLNHPSSRLLPQKQPIHDAESIWKTLKILEFTTTYAILMKLSPQILS